MRELINKRATGELNNGGLFATTGVSKAMAFLRTLISTATL
jgi:hypothetical protein